MKKEFFGLILLILYGFYAFLGSYVLLDNNEGLYAEVAREMLEAGAFIIPTLNYVPYIEKPPLLYWLLSLSFSVFGETATGARLITASFGVLTTISVGWFAHRIMPQKRVVWLAPLILCTSVGFLIFARMVYFDVVFTAFLSLAVMNFYLHHHYKSHQSYGRWAAVFLALAVMAKGFVALVLGGLVVGVFWAQMRPPFQEMRRLFDPVALLLFLMISAPWHIIASLSHEGFAWFYFINEHVLRFLGLREPHDYYSGTVFYYIPRLLGVFFPWTLALLTLFIPIKKTSYVPRDLMRFLWTWALVFLIFFSVSKAKANYYLVTAMPPLAILMALKLADLKEDTPWLTGITAFPLFLLGSAFGIFAWDPTLFKAGPFLSVFSPLDLIWISMLFLGMGGLALKTSSARKIGLCGLSSMVFLTLAAQTLSEREDHISTGALIQEIPDLAQATLYLFQDYEAISAAQFYAKKPVYILDSQSQDLLYGQALDSERFLASEVLQKAPPKSLSYVLVRTRRLEAFHRAFPNIPWAPVLERGPVTLWRYTPLE